jgi:hypothetical protein
MSSSNRENFEDFREDCRSADRPDEPDRVVCESCGKEFDKDDCVPLAEFTPGARGYVCCWHAEAMFEMNAGRVA